MELGVFSLTDIAADPNGGPAPSVGQRMDEIVGYGVLADRLGLDVYGVGEHHTHQYAVSSPAVTLAAVAQATERVRLITTATVLTTLDPVRVYQDFATLDLLSHGRAEVVAGRSAFAEPFALFGVDPADLDRTYAEKLDLLLRLRDQANVTWSGSTRPPLRDAEISPRAHVDQLPVWVAVGGTPTSAQRAGRLGLPMMLGLIGGTIGHARRLVDIYRMSGEQAGHAPESLRVGITSHFYAGADPVAARNEIYPYYHQYLSPRTNGGRGWEVSRAQMDALSERGGAFMVGGPEELTEKILDLQTVLGVDRFVGQVDFGGMPRAMVEDSIARLATEIAPAVREAASAPAGTPR
ncbi:LLM class flavin-dependent oxidoreductase [Cellulomonas hominis]|uniref:LLM class flavin-dependent oxidoreductase n=1 Tax=Cellulomonas hominis TaxID=156981 RepID=UPI001BA43430|nr:LLM class flavin-dependent oxidoreductase [Cellulomonas hominis]VTR75391.1 Alkanal monooxygenase alpha chain [Cellulomonas hominis]